jgi:hypothetical protein
VPSTWPAQFDAPVTGKPHVPSLPSPALQLPEQQSPGRLHTSPVCAQNELAIWQTPSLHSFEQHCSLLSQALPLVRQVALSATHWPSAQVPLQHSASLAHVPSSETQLEAEHSPLKQLSEQHSVEVVQASPACEHWAIEELQVFVALSQMPEQQSLPAWHSSPNATQRAGSVAPSTATPPSRAIVPPPPPPPPPPSAARASAPPPPSPWETLPSGRIPPSLSAAKRCRFELHDVKQANTKTVATTRGIHVEVCMPSLLSSRALTRLNEI